MTRKFLSKGQSAFGRNSQRDVPYGTSQGGALPILILLAALGILGFLLISNTASFRDQLFNQLFPKPASQAATLRGEAGDLWADIVLGHDNFGEGVPGEIVPYKVFNPGGTLVDRSVNPNRVYLYDGANSRVLGYNSLGSCSQASSIQCTNDSDCGTGNTCKLQFAKPAGIVLGQPDLFHSACNGDSNYQDYPNRSVPSATTLCSIPDDQVSTTEGGTFASMAVDSQGNLYVPDFRNNRVLKYISPLTTDTVADELWGQDSFSERNCNKGQSSPTASTICFDQWSPQNPFTAGVDIDSQGNLWVADDGNNRVLRFPKLSDGTIGKTADLVLGQANFQSKTQGSGLNQLWVPTSVRVDFQGKVYVTDSENQRVLAYNPLLSNGMSGTTFGSNFRNPTGIEFDVLRADDPNSGGIWISDSNNNQLLLYSSDGSTVKKVLFKDTQQSNGQCGSATSSVTCRNPQIDPVTGVSVCWDNVCTARGSLGIDRDGNMLVTASSFVQGTWRFKAPIPTPQIGKTYSADTTLHAPPPGSNFSYGPRGIESPRGIAVAADQLIIADTNRILFWNMPSGVDSLSNGKLADGVAGGADFNKYYAWGF